MPQKDHRRSSRIRAKFWVQIEGVDEAARLRGGDLSATGVFFNLAELTSEPGDVLELKIESSDRLKSLRTLARISRVLLQNDLYQGIQPIGAAFEFLPQDKLKPEVIELLQHVTTQELRTFGNIRLDRNVAAQVEPPDGEPFAAKVLSLGADQVVLSGRRALAVGDEVQVEIPYESGGLMSLSGHVTRCTQEPGNDTLNGFGLTIRFDALTEAQDSERISGEGVAVETLMCNLVVPSIIPSRQRSLKDLSGQLSHLRISSVLSLLEMERMTGVLALARQVGTVQIHIAEGRMLDIDSTLPEHTPLEVLEAILGWDDGEFHFTCQPVLRADRLNMTTTGLLLDVLRMQDERAG